MKEVWYRGGRYFFRGPKKGTEEADYVETTPGAARCCQHDIISGLDRRFEVCAKSCGMAFAPMNLTEALALANTLRIKSASSLTKIEKALIYFADEKTAIAELI